MRLKITAIFLLSSGMALAQTSTSFRLEEVTLNSGGAPSQGVDLASASFSITLASVGDAVVATDLAGRSFGMELGFDAAYPPPGEVSNLFLTDKQTLVWSAELSAGVYNLYRDDTSDGYGNCEQQDIAGTTTTDAATPAANTTFYYLVTVENRLAEEGTKGLLSDATERRGTTGLPACP